MVPCDFSSCLLFLPPGDRVRGRDGRGNDKRGTPYAEPDAGGAAPADVTPARGKVMRRGAIRSNQPRSRDPDVRVVVTAKSENSCGLCSP